MAARIVYSGSNPDGRKVIIRYNHQWNEYIVQFHLKGEYLSLCDYYTDDKDDALATAQHHLNKEYA